MVLMNEKDIQKQIKHFEMVKDSAEFTINQLKQQLKDTS